MTPRYPGMQHITYNELVEFARRLAERVRFAPESAERHVAAIYHDMVHECASIEGVSAEGSSWAMEEAHGTA